MKKYKIQGTYAQFFLRCGLYCFLAFFFQSLGPLSPHKGSAVFLNIGLTPPPPMLCPPTHGNLIKEDDKKVQLVTRRLSPRGGVLSFFP